MIWAFSKTKKWEIEEGTVVYLLAKPVARWRIVAGKLLAAWGATGALVVLAALVGGVVTLSGEEGWRVLWGFIVGLAAGSLAYSSLFVMLSTVTSRALLAGLAYVFIWEGIITNFAPGVQRFSIREYTLGVAEYVGDTSPWIFDADVGILYSSIALGVVVVVAGVVGVWKLMRFELVGEG